MAEYAQMAAKPRNATEASTRASLLRARPFTPDAPQGMPGSNARPDRLQAALNRSPRAQGLAQLQRTINQSPRVQALARTTVALGPHPVAQAQNIARAWGGGTPSGEAELAQGDVAQLLSDNEKKALRAYFDRRIGEVGSPTSLASRNLFNEASEMASLAEAKAHIDTYVQNKKLFVDRESAEPPQQGGGLIRSPHTPPLGRQKIPTDTQLHHELALLVMQNHEQHPYATDYFHEQKPMMQAIMTDQGMIARIKYVLAGLLDFKHIFFDYGVEERPQIEIVGFEIIINPMLLGQYEHAGSLLGGSKNVPGFSGHSASMIDTISKTGHRPDLGKYFSGKGHGALGRGAYVSNRVDKAISYSGNEPGTQGQFLLNLLHTGNMLTVTSGTPYRHQTHNSMVRDDRSSSNRTRDDAGISTIDLTNYDSILGSGQHESGASALRASARSLHGGFDSDELLVRNADQILPAFIVHYKVKTPETQGWSWGTLTVMLGGLALGGAVLAKYYK